ncbi:MAG: UDP-N-acetylmuramoyl-tripeptide--D-alanyl-D-alanine ligase [Candidatus Paceibacterota bacterium]
MQLYFTPIVVSATGIIVLLFWLLREIKAFLFWPYLWQLKNYHIGRFLAHFSTSAGRKIFLNPLMIIKIILFVATTYCLFFNAPALVLKYFFWIVVLVFCLYLLEGLISLIQFISKRVKAPELTSKMLFLLPIVFIPLGVFTLVFGYTFIDQLDALEFLLAAFAFAILLFDLLTPFIVSLIILLLQPITVVLRNRVLRAATEKRAKMENLSVIGITGSFGKSSVKEFLRSILSVSFNVAATEENKNSEMGISEYILNNLTDKHEIFICEMGAYNIGGIKLLCDIAKPKIGILTNIGNQHEATFGSLQNIVKAKFELINSLPEEGLAVLNWDSELIRNNFKSNISSIKYSILEKEDIWSEDIKEEKEWVSFRAIFKTGEHLDARVNVIGAQNIINLLPAIAIAKRLGMENSEILMGIAKIDPKQGNIELKRNTKGINIIDASYSANVAGALAHLDYLKNWKDSKKIFVMPCLIELGKSAKQSHYDLGKKIGGVCDVLIVATADYFNQLRKGAIEAGMKKENIFLLTNPAKQYKKIMSIAKEGDVVFVEGRVSEDLLSKLV